jgi:hypothetical protein
MVGATMEIHVVTMLDIGKNLLQCMWMLRIVHAQDVQSHLIDDLSLAISLGVESNGCCELGFQQRPETRPKGVEEPIVSNGDYGLWYPKVDPHSLEEELCNICCYDSIFTCCEDGHL